MKEWWERHEGYLESGGHTKEEVEDLTGRVPLLLNATIRNGKNIDFSAAELVQVSEEVQQFVGEMWDKLRDNPMKWER